jgi:hypothetical protein
MTSDKLIDPGRMLGVLGVEGRLLAAATHDVHPDARVAGASGRTVRESVAHLGDLCEDALSWMGASESAAEDWGLPVDANLRETTIRFTARLADLLAEFGTRQPDEPCPSWWPQDHTVGFWLRRMVHATTVHRVDVQTAAGVRMTPVDTDIALDGIDEVLRVWLGYRLHALGIRATRMCSILVHAADRSWLVTSDAEHITVARLNAAEPSTEDGRIAGDASALLLWLWGRLPDRAIEPTGDLDAIAQLWGLLRLATQ